MYEPHEWFIASCLEAFARLVEEFSFSDPEVDPIGREVFIRYNSGARTVSISFEPGSHPLVELFYPARDTGERPVPWAERDGVERARRFPRLRTSAAFVEGRRETYAMYLAGLADSLIATEADFLRGR